MSSSSQLEPLPRWKRWARWIGPLFACLILALSLHFLHRLLHQYTVAQLRQAIFAIPRWRLVLALLLTALGYLVLSAYDWLALRWTGERLPVRNSTLTGFTAYAITHNVGLGNVVGGSIRYRFYSGWGVPPFSIARVIVFCSLSTLVGLSALSGVSFWAHPHPLPEGVRFAAINLRPIGLLMLLGVAGYLGLCFGVRRRFKFRRWRLRLPSPRLALAQFAISTAEWLIAGLVFYVVLPTELHATFPAVMSLYLFAIWASLLTTVPGGLGVFETMVLYSLQGRGVEVPDLLGALLAFRCCYYFLPFGLALGLLGAHELHSRRDDLRQIGVTVRDWGQTASAVVPYLLAPGAFVAGLVMLISGATPGVHARLHLLHQSIGLPVLEISHFLGSVIGMALLLLSRGLLRRIDAAWLLTCLLLMGGIVVSLLKGLDYEEAIVLTLLLAMLLPSRRHFYRRSSLLAGAFSPALFGAMLVAMFTAIWLGLFAFRHVEYSSEMWWQFSVKGDAPRFLRASVGAVAVLLCAALLQLLRPAPPEESEDRPDLDALKRVIAVARHTGPQLALLGDKHILWSPSRRSFVMYGVERRSWVALGDPVGEPAEFADLIWAFREMSDRHQGWTVFYQATPALLPAYLDLGLNAIKLGEEARVSLANFSLEGGVKKNLRTQHRKLEREGCTFEFVPTQQTAALLPTLQAISDAWLAEKNTREKGFSLGSFTREYITEFPLGLVHHGGEIIAFANLWLAADRAEIAVDLMRYRPGSLTGVMEYLLVSLMLHARAEGYRWFNLGMAPLSGLENRQLAPLWARAGNIIFHHGEHFYNFQGLRAYKQKFDPVWEPRYLIAPGGLHLPLILTNIATLISGGFRGILSK